MSLFDILERELRVSDDVISFVEANSEYWASFSEEISANATGQLLVDVTGDRPETIVTPCSVGNYLAHERGLEPVFLIDRDYEEKKRICRSFYDGEFIRIGSRATPLRLRHSLFRDATVVPRGLKRFRRAARAVETVEDLLNLSMNGIPVGDLVFNQASRATGQGTFDEMTPVLYKFLLYACLMYEQWSQIFDEYDIRGAIVGHIHTQWNGLLARLAVRNGAEAYTGLGSGAFKLCRTMEELQVRLGRPSDEFFECIFENHREQAIERAHEILHDRFGIDPSDVRQNSRVSVPGASPDLLERLSLSPENPTVLLMQQNFVENVRPTNLLFRDYTVWFADVVRHATEWEDINLLVKPHPNREFYESQGQPTVSEMLPPVGGETNIGIVPDGTPFPSLLDSIDAITTLDGTAPLEYSCFGIPAVVGGTTRYTGFEFTLDPDSRLEYFDMLDAVGSLSSLTVHERTRAKVMCYIQLDLFLNNTPAISTDEGSQWEQAFELMGQTSPEDNPLRKDIANFIDGAYKHLFPSEEIRC